MKKIFLVLTSLLSIQVHAQINSVVLEHNNVSVGLSNEGTFLTDLSTFEPTYEVPKGSGNHPIYAAQFWYAGIGTDNVIRTALGFNSNGRDFFHGPVASNYTAPSYQTTWNPSIWEICQTDIEIFVHWWECINGIDTTDCATAITPSNEIMNRIYSWPAHGDLSIGQAFYLAPFYDRNMDGIYNPNDGDYPLFKGCCATYMIENDLQGVHTYSGTDPVGIEIHYMFYQFQTFDYLNDATFVEIRAFNRGAVDYPEFAFGMYLDPDLGYSGDDFIGSDSLRNMAFVYNGDNNDDGEYGIDPPAIGIVGLEQKINSVIPYMTQSTPVEVFNQLNGLYPNGSNYLHPNGFPTALIYSGDPSQSSEWSEFSVGNSPGDRRMIISSANGPFLVGDTLSQTFAILYARNGNNLQNVQAIKAQADQVKTFYDDHLYEPCHQGVWNIQEQNFQDFTIFPNPTTGLLYIDFHFAQQLHCELIDLNGRVLKNQFTNGETSLEFDITNLEAGIYLLRISSKNDVNLLRFVKE